MEFTCRDIAKMIDHSLLKPELTDEDIIAGCELAKKYRVASVCCTPSALPLVRKCLEGSEVNPTTVIGFPHGYNRTATKVFEAEKALEDGAKELDMVINIGKLRSRQYDYVKNDIKAVVDVAHRRGVIVKVIFENCFLSEELKEKGYRLAEEAGADFIKTSTGFAPGGTTLDDLRLMRKTVSEKVQVKAAHGVRDFEMAVKVRNVGATRFGATQTKKIMEECYEKRGKE